MRFFFDTFFFAPINACRSAFRAFFFRRDAHRSSKPFGFGKTFGLALATLAIATAAEGSAHANAADVHDAPATITVAHAIHGLHQVSLLHLDHGHELHAHDALWQQTEGC